MLDLFSLRGRSSRAGFFAVFALTGAAAVSVALAGSTFEGQFSAGTYFLLMAAALTPFAWVLTATTIRRLEDLNWSWMVALPMIPVFFLPLWPFLLGTAPVSILGLAFGLRLYCIAAVVLLSVLKGVPAAGASASPSANPAMPKAVAQCPNGHLYDAKESACPYCPAQPVPVSIPVASAAAPQVVEEPHAPPHDVGVPPANQEPRELPLLAGWLVAIDGPSRGTDYRIYANRNRIGRDPSMEVRLNDESIAAVDHAALTYDPRNDDYSLTPGNGTVELGDLAISGPITLQAYDRLRLGGTTLIVVPLSTYHRWDFRASHAGRA